MAEQRNTFIILSPGFPKDEADTTCLPTQQLFVKKLRAKYPDLKIIVLAFKYPFVDAQYKWNEIDVISFNEHGKGIANHARLWKRIWRLLKQLKRQNNIVGLLSFWCTEYAMVAKRFARKNGIPHFVWLKGQDAREGNPFVKFMQLQGNNLIAISDFVADEFFRNYNVRPAHVVPNAIDEMFFAGTLPVKDIDIIGVGSLIPLKTYDLFVEIVDALKGKYPNIKAVLCGKGVEEGNLRKQIAERHLEANVEIKGEQSHEDAIRLMERSRILLHPSSYEGFSTVCLEALYAGVSVVSFCKPMNNEIKNWHVVKSKEEMLEKVEALLGSNIKSERVKVYTMEEIVHQVMTLYATVAS